MPIINPSFETGDFTGWTVIVPANGSANVVTSFTAPSGAIFGPIAGRFFAVLKTGLRDNFTSVSQTFFACVGDTISGWAFFQTSESPPPLFNDFGQVRILSGASVVATPFSASVSTGNTGWVNWSYTFTASGIYTLEARVVNIGRSAVDSYLGLDAINLSTTAVPITCPDDIVQGNDPGQCGAVVTYPDPEVGCPDLTASCSPASGAFFQVGQTTVTCTAVNAEENTVSECTFTITVIDVEPPIIICPADISVPNDPGECGAVVSYPPPEVFDNCPGVVTECTPPPGFFPVGTTPVTCTATDASGNTAKCTFNVTVNDVEPPIIICPADISVPNDPGECGAVVSYPPPEVFDNCPGVVTECTPPPGFFPVGTTPVTCTATDASGNTAICTFSVTVNDEEPPTIICPSDIEVPSDLGECGAVVSYPPPDVFDNCPGAMSDCTPPPGFFPVGTTPVTCTATDASGNTARCTFNVTVNDEEPPTIICPSDVSVPNDPGECGAFVSYPPPDVFDNCPGAVSDCTPPPGFFPVGTTPVTCTATDASGNTAKCTFNVTVNDVEPPTIICSADITVPNDPGECGAFVSYPPPEVFDNCPNFVYNCTPPPGLFPVGTTPVTCTATDASGNRAICTFSVTVNDVEPPTIQCPPDITQFFDPAIGGAIVTYPDPTVSDNCPGVTSSCSPPSGSLFPLGTTTVTCTATDASGNTADCSFNVNVVESRFRLSSKMVLNLQLKLLQNQQIRIEPSDD